MTRQLAIFIVVVILLVLASCTCLYVVDEREQVIITRFQKPIRTVTEPGLKWKAPFIDTVNVFEKRVLAWDGSPDQIPTSDKKYIFLDTFARWRIVDPLRFFLSVNNERRAQMRLDDIIDGATRDVISRNLLAEVTRNTNRELPKDEEETVVGIEREIPEVNQGRDALARQVFEKAREQVEVAFGIELLDVQIKRINYVQEVRQKVFERMISERKRIAELFRSEGQRNLQEISGLREKELKRIRSEAYFKAQQLRGKADAEAARVYAAAYGKNPEFYQFTQALKAYPETLTGESTLILSTDSDYLKYLKKLSSRR